jgi:hypothetical protein
MIGDGGYQGTGPLTPHKKPPGGDLTTKQKTYNYSLNRLRAAVDRADDVGVELVQVRPPTW